jgi:hypothetical protein
MFTGRALFLVHLTVIKNAWIPWPPRQLVPFF